MLWIATAWLAAGLYIGPAIGGAEPPRQRAGVNHWYARSAGFLQTGLMNDLRWMRVVGDTALAFGALLLTVFVAGLATGWSYRPGGTGSARSTPRSIEAGAPDPAK